MGGRGFALRPIMLPVLMSGWRILHPQVSKVARASCELFRVSLASCLLAPKRRFGNVLVPVCCLYLLVGNILVAPSVKEATDHEPSSRAWASSRSHGDALNPRKSVLAAVSWGSHLRLICAKFCFNPEALNTPKPELTLRLVSLEVPRFYAAAQTRTQKHRAG